jgi:hypothetical protein
MHYFFNSFVFIPDELQSPPTVIEYVPPVMQQPLVNPVDIPFSMDPILTGLSPEIMKLIDQQTDAKLHDFKSKQIDPVVLVS